MLFIGDGLYLILFIGDTLFIGDALYLMLFIGDGL